MADIRIGLSGYSYRPWQGMGRFYPEDVKPAEFLRHYATRYRAVELDGIWNRLPTTKTVQSWIDQTPARFLFSPKAHRSITHLRRLKSESYEAVRLMLDRLAPLATNGRSGPILLQLPPNLTRDDDRLGQFLAHLDRKWRWAMEFRHPSWQATEVEQLLRAHGVAWSAVETDEIAGERRTTAGFCYIRLRQSAYRPRDLRRWADWLKQQAQEGRDCFVFFKHEDEGAPWIWADQLLRLVES